MRTIYRTIVSALIFSKDGKLLMGMKDPKSGGVYADCWHIPGGGVDDNETKEQALRREILEEVGINIANCKVALVDNKGVGETEKTLKNTGETVLCKMQFNVYRVDVDEDADNINTELSDDLVKLAWIELSQLNEYKLTPPSIKLFSQLGYLNHRSAIIFDIDGTLSPEISWLALTRDLGASVDEHIRIYTDYKEGRITYEESKRQLIGIWHATGNANKPFFQKLFEDWPLDPAAKHVIERVRKEYTLCLITGSMDLYAQIVARKLGVKHWYANTTLHWNEQDELIDMDYELEQADKKLEQFAEFCKAQELKPQDCIVVGDGENDLGLFKLSGNGVLLLGDEKADEYRQYAWKVTPNLVALEQILDEN